MRKLFVFPKTSNSEYFEQLKAGYEILKLYNTPGGLSQIDINNLTADFLIDNKIDIVISNGLPKEWYLILKSLKIVTLTLDELVKYNEPADIVIDYKNEKSNKYFTGTEYSLINNKKIEIEFTEIANLIKKLDWDTNFWNFPVAYLSCKYLTESIIYRSDKFLKSENIKLIEYLCNCHDNKSVKLAAENNFIFTDIRLSFEKKLKEKENIDLPTEFRFGLARQTDISALRDLAKDIYLDSRYYFDENFDRQKTSEFYRNWVEKAVLGTFDDECYCLFDKNKDIPIGFCTIKYEASNIARIGLVGLSARYQGRGIAKTLLYLIFNKLIDKNIFKILVVTQGRNYAAQRLYQGVRFLTKATEIWYHKWL